MKKSTAAVMFLFRVCLLLFFLIMTLQKYEWGYLPRDPVLLSFGIYQILIAAMYWFIMKISRLRILLCIADMLIIQVNVLLTGGLYSPFLVCLCIPVFTLHTIYGIQGLVGGIMGSLAGFSLVISDLIDMQAALPNISDRLIVIGIGLILFYIIPFIILNRGVYIFYQLQAWKNSYRELDQMNNKLLAVFEMTGRFRLDMDITQIMDRLLVLCNELFSAEEICIFLIRNGEVEIYGSHPNVEEKEGIYQMIVEQKSNKLIEVEREFIFRENTLVIPLIRGTQIDGVLYFRDWEQFEITNKDAVLFTMIANMVCTYLESLEYVASLNNMPSANDCVILKRLDSGKAVKGILDKRIISQELVGQ